jgi:anthranilate synthase component II
LKVLILDNYDSFTFNLFHAVEAVGGQVSVVRSDQWRGEEVRAYDKIILSPGPGLPKDSTGMMHFISEWHARKPILGVCLGMQALASFFGDQLFNMAQVMHGVQINVEQVKRDSPLFKNVPHHFQVGLYHSWAVSSSADSSLVITSRSENGITMSFEHEMLPIYGVQFHPESILTPQGREIIRNFIEL